MNKSFKNMASSFGRMSSFSLALGALVLTASPAQADEEYSFTGGADYSTGDYGLDLDTDIYFVYVAGQVETGNWRFKVTVPWLRIEGPGNVTGGGIIVGPGDDTIVSNSGIGDIILQGGYLINPGDSGLPWVELLAKVKLPTANENKGLGTGKADYSLQADFFKQFGNVTPFATIGYRIFGDPSEFTLNNTVFASAGFTWKAGENMRVGGTLDWREATVDTSSEKFEISPFISYDFGDGLRLTGYGVFGLSDGSPDAGVGVYLRWKR